MQTEYTTNGIMYTWELASSEGASFILFPTPKNTREEIKAAKAEIRDNQDVVYLKVADDADKDDLFKSQYFSDPRTKALKWYEMEQDKRLIRQQRLSGKTPEQFVTDHVLPFVKQVTARHLKQYGQKMYGI